jgi:hypothetical protein
MIEAKHRSFRAIPMIALASSVALPAFAADALSALELKAAYCLKETDASIKLMIEAPKPPTQMLQQLRDRVQKKQEEKRDQLQAFLKSRPNVFDAEATKSALKTVDSDAKIDATGRRSIRDRCATECKTTNPPPTPETRTCVETCAKNDEVARRLDRCTTLEWLAESAKGSAAESTLNSAKDAVTDAPKETAEDAARDAAKEPAKDAPKDSSKDAAPSKQPAR